MPCQVTQDDEGRTTFVCVRGARRPDPCECGRPAVALCDWPMEKPTFGKPTVTTCDAPLCRDHRVHVGRNTDYCIAHSLEAPVEAR